MRKVEWITVGKRGEERRDKEREGEYLEKRSLSLKEYDKGDRRVH